MKSRLTDLQKLPRCRSARIVSVFFASLMLLAMATFALRGASADALNKFGVTTQSRVGKLIGKIAPHAFAPKLAAKSAPFACNNLTVNNLGDGTDATPGNGVCETATGNGVCTLRAAIQEANALSACAPFTINFSVTGTITLGSALPAIAHPNLTINGPGASNLTVSGNNAVRVMQIASGSYNVNLSGLTLKDGYVKSADTTAGSGTNTAPTAIGGGLYTQSTGTVNITDCVITNNTLVGGNATGGTNVTGGSGNGAGIYIDTGTVKFTRCTISSNSAFGGLGTGGTGVNLDGAGYGTGIYKNVGSLTIEDSTIADNLVDRVTGSTNASFSAVQGIGIYAASGSLTITGTTFNNNKRPLSASSVQGGALTIQGSTTASLTNCTISNHTGSQTISINGTSAKATLTNCTVANNTLTGASSSGAILVQGGCTLDFKNTILAYNTVAANIKKFGTVTSQGNNLDSDGSTGFSNGVNGDIVGTSLAKIDPLLASLGNYGGLTQTHALLPGSTAINAGTATGAPTSDQRGSARGGNVDIGAFESQGFTLAVSGGNNQSATVGTAFALPLSVTVTSANSEPVNGGQVTFTPPGSGASCTLAGNPATISSGAATTGTVTANGTAGGPYNVAAGAIGATSINFALTNSCSVPAIGTQPTNQTVCAGLTATFSVAATGTGLTYQWRKNGTNISGATASSYTTPATVAGDNGALYSVVVSGSCGTPVTSSNATLTVNNATAITTQPQSATVCVGATASFSVTATGTGLTYQWRKNGVNISGATAGSYTTPATTVGDNGALYSVIVTGTCGTPVTSGNATLTVNATTVITTQPASQTVCASAPASFSVAASGTGLTYQWRKGGLNISGATGSSYTIAATTAGDAANYDVVVTGACGTVTSSAAVLTVNPTTAITMQPVSLSRMTGQSAPFSVAATGTNLTYQWRKNAINIPGATAVTYNIASVVPGDAGSYSCVVTGTCGTVTSSTAVLNVDCVTITVGPSSLPGGTSGTIYNQQITVTPAGTYTFAVASGALPTGLSLNSTTGALTGTPTAAGTFNFSLTATDANNCSDAQSYSVTICAPPAVVTPPAPQTVCAGSPVTFSVTATGSGLSYQWRKNSANLPGATSSSLTIAAATAADAASYDVVITGTCGTATSSAAALTVNVVTAITTPPVAQTACEGSPASFSVVAAGTNLTYQWRKNSVNVPGATGSTFSIASPTTADAASYDVVVSGSCGASVASNVATLTVNTAPAISAPPVDQTVCANAPVSFSVAATGTGLSYQWKKYNVNLPGATLSSYSIAAATAADAATYTVVVSGVCGTPVTSANAVLTVNPLTAITTPPINQATCLGGTVTFNVTAAGTNLTYQWRKGGNNLPGATSSSLVIASITANDAASYDVVVTGACGALTSSAATLTINATTSINSQPANQTACVGGSVGFSVAASGAGTLTYQWRKNGVNLNGATAASLTLNPVAAADAAQYDAVVSSDCGATTSNAASLTVNPVTAISAQPPSLAVCTGAPASFSVTASGTGLTYQWRKGGININGATAASYAIAAANANDAAGYDVVVTGACGTVTSAVAVLTVNAQTAITTPPVSQTKTAGQSATFSVTATGTNLNYQWRKNSASINGATASTYSLASAVPGDAAQYDVVVSGACGNQTSTAATLSVGCQAITVTPATLGSTTAGATFNQVFSQTGANGTITWSLIDTAPPGLSFNAATASLSGSLAQSGSFSFTIRATDQNNCSGERQYTLNTDCASVMVNPASATLPVGMAGQSYSQSFTAAGGTLPYTFTTNAGTLPPGLNLNANTGALSGTPTGFGLFNFTIKATDAKGCAGTQAYSLQINPPCGAITVNPTALANGFAGTVYNQTFTAAGGVAPYNFAVSAGALPGGLSLNASTGALTGTPTSQSTFNFTIQATDANGCQGTRSYSVIISGNGLLFYPLAQPIRLLDTRPGQAACDAPGAPMQGQVPHTELARVTCSSVTIPANAQAIAGIVTVVNSLNNFGYGTLYPTGGSVPNTANLNYTPQGVAFNSFITGLNAAGQFNIFSFSTVDVVIDVIGYFAPPSAGGLFYHSLPQPIRLLETRSGQQGCDTPGVPITGQVPRTEQARVTCSGITIPQAAQAITGSFTVVNNLNNFGYGTLYPAGGAVPNTANLNYTPFGVAFNSFITGLNATGEFNLFTFTTVHAIIDVDGYFSPEPVDANGTGLLYTPLSSPIRLLETRPGQQGCDTPGAPLQGQVPRTQLARVTCGGVTIPATAQAITGIFTVVNNLNNFGYGNVYPTGGAVPNTANLNYVPFGVAFSSFITGLDATSEFNLFAFTTVHAIIDVAGYFAP